MTTSYLCSLCPRACKTDRSQVQGFCRCGPEILVARAARHDWEEPCISGTRGSGAVFFAGCTLQCIYCQNISISRGENGKEVTPKQLADILRRLTEEGVHNINFVTGTHFIPGILEALRIYRPPVPLVWNTSGYERPEALKALQGIVDIYLPDFKHISPRIAKLCANAPDYADQARAAITEMVRQTGQPQYDENGLMLRGTLIRHLILPGCSVDSMHVLDCIAALFPGIPVSLMRQYTPPEGVSLPAPLNRRVTDAEYERVLEHYIALGLSGYTQEKEAARSAYTPAFDLTGVENNQQ